MDTTEKTANVNWWRLNWCSWSDKTKDCCETDGVFRDSMLYIERPDKLSDGRAVPPHRAAQISCRVLRSHVVCTSDVSDMWRRHVRWFLLSTLGRCPAERALELQRRHLVGFPHLKHLTPLDKMAAISQTTCSNAFSLMKIFEFETKFHWNMFFVF